MRSELLLILLSPAAPERPLQRLGPSCSGAPASSVQCSFPTFVSRVRVLRSLRQTLRNQRVQYRPPPNEPAHRAHVCMVVHSYYPVGEPRAEREARAAVEAGYAVDVICLRRPYEPAFERVDDIGVVRLPVEHVRGRTAARVVAEYVGFAARAAVA